MSYLTSLAGILLLAVVGYQCERTSEAETVKIDSGELCSNISQLAQSDIKDERELLARLKTRILKSSDYGHFQSKDLSVDEECKHGTAGVRRAIDILHVAIDSCGSMHSFVSSATGKCPPKNEALEFMKTKANHFLIEKIESHPSSYSELNDQYSTYLTQLIFDNLDLIRASYPNDIFQFAEDLERFLRFRSKPFLKMTYGHLIESDSSGAKKFCPDKSMAGY